MSCAAIIAVKGTATAKSRLAGALPPAIRARLVVSMLDHVIDVARRTRGVDGIVLVSDAAQEARSGVLAVLDEARGLDAAFLVGARAAQLQCFRSAVLLPADLPLLTVADLEALLDVGPRAGAAIAPDRAGDGTNALYLPLALPILLAYGPRSCASHRDACMRLGLAPALVQRSGLATDIDEPCDLAVLSNCPTYDFLPSLARFVA